jgi:hypothetical protein
MWISSAGGGGAAPGAGENPAEQRRWQGSVARGGREAGGAAPAAESGASIAMRERDERVDVREDNVSLFFFHFLSVLLRSHSVVLLQ